MKSTLKISGIVLILLAGMATTVNRDTGKYFEITKNIEIFTNLYKELNTYYVDDLDPGKLMRTGIDAMVASLDPYTNYISESDIESYRYMTEGRYNGIGARSKKMGEFVTITELYEGQPADRAGLKPGDQIIAVNGQDAKNKDPEAVNNILQGFPGTEVELTIRRPGKDNDFNVSLKRDEVDVPNVPFYGLVSEDIGYVALSTFTREAARNVGKAVRELKSQNENLKGVILDLRNNGGGLLSEAVDLCNLFIPRDEVVVTTKGKVKEWDRSFRTQNQPMDLDIPLAVVINNYSASASEIVSGVMQDYDRGVLIGRQSYGKGLVQNTRDIGYNAKVKLTTAKYYIPSGRCIQNVQYEDGEPVSIPDSQRTKFKTNNGRVVLDGGGVRPDVQIEKPAREGVLKALNEQDLIFEYVTDYCLQRDSIPPVEKFEFQQFDQFVSFLEERGFDYETKSEKLLNKLLTATEKEGYALEDEIDALRSSIKAEKRDAIQQYREAIISELEKEIVSRYYYQDGRIRMGLRNDEEIEQAITVLRDSGRYQEILAVQ